jgi:hypothetical protein
MQVTGELSLGAMSIVVTLLTLGIGYLLTSARQTTKFDLMIAAMQADIKTNRDAFTGQLIEIRADLKALDKSNDEVKLSLAALSAQQGMAQMFANLPEQLARAMGDARGRHWDRHRDQGPDHG